MVKNACLYSSSKRYKSQLLTTSCSSDGFRRLGYISHLGDFFPFQGGVVLTECLSSSANRATLGHGSVDGDKIRLYGCERNAAVFLEFLATSAGARVISFHLQHFGYSKIAAQIKRRFNEYCNHTISKLIRFLFSHVPLLNSFTQKEL